MRTCGVILGIVAGLAYGQASWLQVYGGVQDDEFTAIDVRNGIVAVGGVTQTWGAGGQDGWFLRLDPLTGSAVWVRTWGYSSDEAIYDVVVHPNGTIVYSGEGFRGSWTDVFLAGVSTNGQLQWTRLLPHRQANDVWHIFLDEFRGDTLMVWGDINAVSGWRIGAWDGYYFQLSTGGNVLNQYLYGGGSTNEGTHDMVWQADGNRLLLLWSFNIGPGSADFLVAKISPAGSPVWERLYGTAATEVPWAIIPYHQHFLLIGWIEPGAVGGRDIIVMRIDTAGQFLWGKVYGTVGNEQIQSAEKLPDGRVVLAGWLVNNTGDEDAALFFLDSLGHLYKYVAIGDAGNERFVDVAVEGTNVYACGWTTSWSIGGDRDGLVIRTDTSGYVQCYWRSAQVDSADYVPMVLTPSLSHVSRSWNERSGPALATIALTSVFECKAYAQVPQVRLQIEKDPLNGQVTLLWEPVAIEESQVVKWRIKKGFSPDQLTLQAELETDARRWTDRPDRSVSVWYYQVVMVLDSGTQIFSPVVKATLGSMCKIVLVAGSYRYVIDCDPSHPLQVVDPSGRCVLQWEGEGAEINLSYLPAGWYWVVNGPYRKRLWIGAR